MRMFCLIQFTIQQVLKRKYGFEEIWRFLTIFGHFKDFWQHINVLDMENLILGED
jgi:hypothetical protein